jgi:hypothetical protein
MRPDPLALQHCDTLLQIGYDAFGNLFVQALVIMPRIVVPAIFPPMSACDLLHG